MELFTSNETKRNLVLSMSTFGFVVCFAVWVIFSIIGKPIQAELGLSNTEFGVLIGTPILTGAFLRPLFGALSDRFGGRRVFFLLMISALPPLYLIGGWASAYWHFLVLGLFVGIVGTSFAVGISYVVKWFPKERQGFAMGIFGSGNVGTALTQFAAPILIAAYGWRMVPKVYAVILLMVAIIFLLFTFTDESHRTNTKISEQFAVMKDPKAWRYFQYYSLTFGGFIALALWMPSYYMSAYGFTLQDGALMAMVFALPGSLIRAYGGWLADKYGAFKVTRSIMWVALFCLTIISYPPSDVIFHTLNGDIVIPIHINMWVFTGVLMVLGLALGIGNASIFKYAADDFPKNTGAVFGAIGLGGGLGGYLLPIIFGAILDYTGIYTTAFMFLWGVAAVSLTALYWSKQN
ncbi:MAG: nitrate/nitrite transporter [Candidatus Paceibacterota bacterium]|jgi:NNP family nitrate/nitrite transporter-like MFS transporter|nr:NarK/NasA family nitrate transporter [Candidatus Paceibacterota bacterium]